MSEQPGMTEILTIIREEVAPYLDADFPDDADLQRDLKLVSDSLRARTGAA